ncbi:MAG: hypothetical protein NC924_05755 [Candidatus Omnitrophica bacterium]|nr:hypothetical protein [Candidatus Omnitrophota bacterium]
MEAFIKLVIYIVILIFWIAAQRKRDGWDEKIPDFPEEPQTNAAPPPAAAAGGDRRSVAIPKANSRALPAEKNTPVSAGKHGDDTIASRTYAERLRQRREQLKPSAVPPEGESFPKSAEPAVINSARENENPLSAATPRPAEVSIPARPAVYQRDNPPELISKPFLQSTAKEGIIWSAILNPPRCLRRWRRAAPPF